MLLAGTNIQVRNPKVFSESSHSDRETDVAWKTSHWSSTLEAALHESDPCFSSLSIPHSSLASTSLLRFKDQDTAFDIQLKFRGSSCLPLDTCAFHCEKLWSVSQTYLQIIPSDFQSSFCLFYEGGLPFSLNSDSFLSASTPRPPFLPSCRHSSTQFSLLFVRMSQDWATVGAWVNLKTAVLIRWRTETLCSVNNFIKASHRRRLWIFAKKMWRNSKLSTQRHTRSPSTPRLTLARTYYSPILSLALDFLSNGQNLHTRAGNCLSHWIKKKKQWTAVIKHQPRRAWRNERVNQRQNLILIET